MGTTYRGDHIEVAAPALGHAVHGPGRPLGYREHVQEPNHWASPTLSSREAGLRRSTVANVRNWPKADWRLLRKGPWKAAVGLTSIRRIYSAPSPRGDPAGMCQKRTSMLFTARASGTFSILARHLKIPRLDRSLTGEGKRLVP
jgi:hypothetical protein